MYEIIDEDYYASYNLHLLIPEWMDIGEENKAYNSYYSIDRYLRKELHLDKCSIGTKLLKDFLLANHSKEMQEEFGNVLTVFEDRLYISGLDFEGWLLMRGAKEVTEDILGDWCEH